MPRIRLPRELFEALGGPLKVFDPAGWIDLSSRLLPDDADDPPDDPEATARATLDDLAEGAQRLLELASFIPASVRIEGPGVLRELAVIASTGRRSLKTVPPRLTDRTWNNLPWQRAPAPWSARLAVPGHQAVDWPVFGGIPWRSAYHDILFNNVALLLSWFGDEEAWAPIWPAANRWVALERGRVTGDADPLGTQPSLDNLDTLMVALSVHLREVSTACAPYPWLADDAESLDDHHRDLIRRLLDGMSPLPFTAHPDGTLTAELRFSAAPGHRHGPYHLPTHLQFTLNRVARPGPLRRGDLRVRSLTLTWPDRAPRTFTPAEDETWAFALYVARSALLLAGEIDQHLAAGHLYAEAALMSLRGAHGVPDLVREGANDPGSSTAPTSPLYWLLRPHLHGADGINHFGDLIILGETGVLVVASALTKAGLDARLLDGLRDTVRGGLNPAWTPPAPVCVGHRFAEAGAVVWDLCRRHVDRHLDAAWWADHEDTAATFVRQLAASVGLAAPGEVTADHVRHLAAHAIWHATFLHQWVNDRQQRDGMDPSNTAAFGLRTDSPGVSAGDDAPGDWRDHRPTPGHAAFQTFLAITLSNLHTSYLHPSGQRHGILAWREAPYIRAFEALLDASTFARLTTLDPEHIGRRGLRMRMDV
jgi:hypothetical protein